MGEKRFSGWAVLLIVIMILGVAGVAVAGGVAFGFKLGRATAQRAAFPRVFGFRYTAPFHQQHPDFDEMPRLPGKVFPPLERTGQPYLGVVFQPVTAELAEQHDLPVEQGAWIIEVIEGSPAEQADLRVGDVVVAVDGSRVAGDRTLSAIILQFEPGDQIELEVRRGQRSIALQVELGRRPADIGPAPSPRERP